MRITLPAGGWIDHHPRWVDRAEADAVLAALLAELAWEQREIVLFGRRVLQPRLIAWAGDVPYRYSGQTLPCRPAPPALARLTERVRTVVGVPFNHVLANRYRDGADSMGFHADAEPELGDDPTVASVSFGVPRRLVMKQRHGRLPQPLSFQLGHGDLFVMGPPCQREYLHGVPRQAAVLGERVSVTFRLILRAPTVSPGLG